MKQVSSLPRRVRSRRILILVAAWFAIAATQVMNTGHTLTRQKKWDQRLTMWRLKAQLIGHRRDIKFEFSPNGQTLATGGDDSSARLWDVATGQLKTKLPGHKFVGTLIFSPDGRTIETGDYGKTVRLWDAQTGQLKKELVGKQDFISSVAFSADSRAIATGSLKELIVRLWDVETGQLIATLSHEKECRYCGTGVDVAFSPDGRTIATSSFRKAYLWDATTKKLRMTLVDERYNQRVRLTRRGKSDEVVVETFTHGQTIYRIAFSPDGRTLATGSRDFWAKLWDVATGQLRATLEHKGKILTLAFSRDGKTLATGSEDTTAKLWDVATGQLKATLNHRGTVWSIDFSPDGKLIATAADNDHSVKIWDVATGQLLNELKEARYPATFSPDGRTLATGGEKGAVLLWDVPQH